MRRQRAGINAVPAEAATTRNESMGAGRGFGGRGNAAMLERMRGQQHDQQTQHARFAGSDQLLADVRGEPLIATNVDAFMKTNIYKAMVRLVEKEGWDAEFAAAWLGQAVVETGKANLERLDVVERGSGRGRGMFQYTGARRRPYDRSRQRALGAGKDPNDINWQIDYALREDNPAMNLDEMRQGLTDPNRDYQFHERWGVATGKSPTGERYGNRFSSANQLMTHYGDDRAAGYTRALTGEYTRPGTTHMDRRLTATKRIINMWKQALRKRNSQTQPKVA